MECECVDFLHEEKLREGRGADTGRWLAHSMGSYLLPQSTQSAKPETLDTHTQSSLTDVSTLLSLPCQG